VREEVYAARECRNCWGLLKMHNEHAPGKMALLLALSEEPQHMIEELRSRGLRSCAGKVGSTEVHKILTAIETAAIREHIVAQNTRELHALYHAAFDSMHGLLRGDLGLGSLLRTVGGRFGVVRLDTPESGWIAVAVYGTIGSFMKGREHEAAGLGVSHI